MTTWFETLQMELDLLAPDDVIEPDGEREPKETYIGEMPILAQKLWTLGVKLDKTADQCALERKYTSDNSKKRQLEGDYTRNKMRAELLKSIMWLVLRDTFDQWHDNIGVRENFQVVKYPEDEHPFSGRRGLFFGGQP